MSIIRLRGTNSFGNFIITKQGKLWEIIEDCSYKICVRSISTQKILWLVKPISRDPHFEIVTNEKET